MLLLNTTICGVSSGCLGISSSTPGSGRFECPSCAKDIAEHMVTHNRTVLTEDLEDLKESARQFTHFPPPTRGKDLSLGDPVAAEKNSSEWWATIVLLQTRVRAVGEYMLGHTGFNWSPPHSDTAGRHEALVRCFQALELQLSPKDQACVDEFIRRGTAGFPFGYTRPTYTVEEGYSLVAARDLPKRTIVAIYSGDLVDSTSRVFTNTLMVPRPASGTAPTYHLYSEDEGCFGRFLSTSDKEANATLCGRQCCINGAFCVVFYTNVMVPEATKLTWWYGEAFSRMLQT